MPTKVFFGEGVLLKYGEAISTMGKTALVVTDKNSAKLSGAGEDLVNALKKEGVSYTIFDSVAENPTMEIVEAGACVFRNKKCDFLIGVGGGSSIDAAKAISVVVANNITCSEIYDSKKIKWAHPIVAIPTTAGTGTEATPFSVITDEKNKRKAGFESEFIFPRLAFLDPRYTLSLSEGLTRNTAIDALSHLLEGLYSTQRDRLLYPLIYDGAATIYHNLSLALKEPKNIKYRERLMQASLFGGIVIAHTSTTLQHAIGNPITTEFGVPHGLINGIVMKEIMELYYPAIKDELDPFFSHLKISKNEFHNWLKSFDMNLSHKLTEDFIERGAASVMKSGDIPISPVNVTADTIKNIYKRL